MNIHVPQPPVLNSTDKVTCPFNPAHVMNYSRFHQHFVKCKLQHPEDRRKQCPYNFSELIDPDKLPQHILVCPYRQNYGFRSGVACSNASKIIAPVDIDFDLDNEKVILDDTCSMTRDVDVDEIDSISVVEERRSYFNGSRYARESVTESDSAVTREGSTNYKSTALSSMTNMSISNFGRGRGAFVRRSASLNLLSMNEHKTTSREVETINPTKYDDVEENAVTSSWICKANIEGKKPLERVTDDVSTKWSSSTTSRPESSSGLLAELKTGLQNLEFGTKKSKMIGRGRGMIFSRD